MNYTIQHIFQCLRVSSFLCLFLVCICSCGADENVISPEAFGTVNQEILGDQLFDALTQEGSSFDILDREENMVLYNHVEELYAQSFDILRSAQGWTDTRKWRIAIFVDENQNAFTFPGGNMMISTGMLKTFRREYELFYLMSFENALMDSGSLFSNFLTFIEDSIDVERLIEERNMEVAYDIAKEMVERLEFDSVITENIDLATLPWICRSSLYRIDGIMAFFPRLEADSKWLLSRMSSLNRLETVREAFLSSRINCMDEDRITALPNSVYVNEILPLIP